MVERAHFHVNDYRVWYDAITDLNDVDTVVQKITADFVINAINRALKDRALRNYLAGVPTTDLTDD